MLKLHDINDKITIKEFASILEQQQDITFSTSSFIYNIFRDTVNNFWVIQCGSKSIYLERGLFSCRDTSCHSAKHAIEFMLCE